jgi:hypothetical protein
MKKVKCEKHGYRGKCPFCPDCEIEKIIYIGRKIEKDQKETKYEKAVYKRTRNKPGKRGDKNIS